MDDFVFGTTNFSEERALQVRRRLGGVVHAHRTEPLAPQAGDVVTIWLWVGDQQRVDHACCFYTTDGSEPQGERGVAGNGDVCQMWPGSVEWVDLRWSFGRWWHAQVPPQPEGTLVRYRLQAWSASGGESVWADDGELFSYMAGSPAPPAWIGDAVIYHVFVDRFYAGDGRPWLAPRQPTGFYGGTLQGVREKLDYIGSTGANTLWLSPVFSSPSHHGYDCTDYYHVDERHGGNDALRRLVDDAHRRGMRVLLDFVANHCSNQHPFFLEAQRERASQYANWFTFTRWPGAYASFFGVKSLPQWNLNHPPTRQYIIDAACYWLREFDIDGYRLDYTLGPSHDFWLDFHRAVRRTRRDTFCIAEAVESPEVMRSYSGRIEGCLDFPLLEAMRRVFGGASMDVGQLDAFLTQRAAYFPENLVLGSFLDNHDMNRFLWMAGGDKRRLKLAALCQFSLPSVPIIYYGTEAGIEQSGDVRGPSGNAFHHHARTPMPWGAAQDQDLLAYYRRLADLRRAHPALRRGASATVYLNANAGVYAYLCRLLGDRVLVALNTGGTTARFTVPVAALGIADGAVMRDALHGESYHVADGQVQIALPTLSGAALEVL